MSFEVYISGTSSTAEEWKQALEADKSRLPVLDSEQKEVARRFQISEEDYARSVLAGQLSEDRHKERGKRLGEAASQVLEGLGSGYRLDAVLRKGTDFKWLLRIENPKGFTIADIPLDVADDVIDSGAFDATEKLRVRVLESLGRTELLRKQ